MFLGGTDGPHRRLFMSRFFFSFPAFISAPNWILLALFACALVAHPAARADERALQGNGSPWVLALQGDRQAAETLAIRSIQSDGDTKKWVFWTLISAENGTRAAQARYAWMLLHGLTSSVPGLPVAETKFRAIFWACRSTVNTKGAKALLAEFGANEKWLNFDLCAARRSTFILTKKKKDIFFPQIVPSIETTRLPELRTDALLGRSFSAQSLANYYLSNDPASDALMNYWFSIQAENNDAVGAYNYGLLLSQKDGCLSQRGNFWMKRAASHGLYLAKEFLKSQTPPNDCSFTPNLHDLFSDPRRPPVPEGFYIHFPYYRETPLFIKNPDVDPFSL